MRVDRVKERGQGELNRREYSKREREREREYKREKDAMYQWQLLLDRSIRFFHHSLGEHVAYHL